MCDYHNLQISKPVILNSLPHYAHGENDSSMCRYIGVECRGFGGNFLWLGEKFSMSLYYMIIKIKCKVSGKILNVEFM